MLLRSIVASLALLSLAGAARAEIKTWDGGAGTNLWSTAANWSPDGVPTAADDVVIDLPGALTIVVSGGNAAASIQCAETLQLTSGTLTVSGDSTCAGLAFTGSATLTGAGDVVVTDSFTWLIGAMTGTGTTIIQPTATMNLAPSNGAQRTLSRTLDLQTSGTLSGSGTIFLGSGGLLRVEPGTTLTVDGPVNVSIASGSPSIVIDGTLVKTGTGSLTVSGVQTKNQGLVEVQSGSVVLSGSGTHTGDFALASGASLKLASSVNTFEATSSITGGTLECAAGGSVFHGPIAVDHLLGAGGTPTLNGSLITPKITLTGGSLTLNSPVTVTTLSMTTNSPTLTGSGTVTVEGALTWIAGSMSGSGATVVEPQATVNLAAPTAAQRTLSRTLSLGADATLAGTGTFYLGTNGLFRVESGVTLTVDAAFNLSVANGSPSIVIDGTLVKSGAGTLTINAGLNTQNNGSVDLLAGAILLNSSGTHSGDFALAPGTLLKLGSQANLFQPSSSVTGGTLEVAAGGNSFQGSIEVDALHCSGGSTTISGSAFTPSISVTSGALTVNVPMTVASVSLSGSSPTLTGSGTMTVTDSFVWAAGVISGSGATTVEPTASATLVAPAGVQRALGRTLHLGAHATLAGSGTFFLSSGGLLRIVSGTTLTLDGAVSFAVASGTPSIVIDGSMVKSGAGTLTINPSVTTQNNGSVEVVAGGLTLNGPGTHIGDFTFAPGTTFKLGSQANLFQPSSSVTGGALELSTGGTSFQGLIDVESITCSGGSTTIAGSALAQSISISSGALTVNVPMTVQSLSLAGSGPTLTGSGTVTVTDNFAWTAGVMSGSGVTVVQPTAAATLVAAPSVQRTLQRELQLRANATLAGNGAFFCGSNGFFLVDTGATLTVDGGVSVALSSGAPTVSVKGELVKTGAGSLVFNSGVKLANTGQLTVAGGTVAVITASQLLQVSGTTLTGGGWTVANGATLAFPASTTIRTVATGASVTLEGSSSVFTAIAPLTTINNGGSVAFLGGRDFAAAPVGGIFTNNGTLALGAASDLDIGGAYAQAGGASLVASFGDVNETPLAVTGTATIGGSLAITHAPGFQPPTPSQMTLLSAASVSGTFASIDTPVGGASTEPPPILYTTSTVLYSVATEAQVDLVASSLTPPANATLAAPLTLSWTLTNAAAGPAQGPWTDRVYLSADAAFGDDIELGSLVYASVLQGNQSVLREATFTVPANAFGPRYLIVRTDATNVIDELNERNNTLVSVTPIEILAPDLIVQAIAAPPTVVEGQATPIEWTIRNAGNAASGGLTSTLRWSADAFADAGDPVLATVTSGGPIAPGTNVLAQTSVTLPIAGAIPLGQGYLLVAADSTNAVTESDEANNLLAQAISVVEPPLPDLLAHSLVVPATVSAGAPVTLTWTTQNNGELATTANWVERFQLLAAPDATTALATIGQPTYATPLPAGASVPHSLTVTIPNSLGQRWLALDVDANNTIVEASGEANNRLVAGPITVVGANLVITAASGPTAAEVLQTISVSYTGANIGEGSSYGGCWFDRLYLSLDGTVDASDVSLGLESRCTSPFVPGAQYVDTIGGAIPAAVLPGSYQLLLVVDSNGSRFESNESDNTTLVGTIEIAPPTTPNLIVTAVAAPTSATIGETLSVTWTDVNAGDEPLAQAWQDRVYLSTDATFGGDVGLAPLAASAPLAPGSSLGRSQTIPVPATPGSYWIFVRTDDAGQVTEWNGEGDNVSLAFGPIEVSYGDLPDLAASGLSTPEVISVGAPIALAWTTTNAGPGNAVGPWLERAVILDAPNAATGSTLGQITTAGPLAAGASIARGVTGTMPEAVGVRWIAVDVDAGSAVVEGSNESNNRFVSAPITVVAADLRPLNGQGPSAGEVLSPVTVTYDVTNEGVGDSYGGCWLDRLYLSTDQTLDVNDTVLGQRRPLRHATRERNAVRRRGHRGHSGDGHER
jgi:subtilase family serine protease